MRRLSERSKKSRVLNKKLTPDLVCVNILEIPRPPQNIGGLGINLLTRYSGQIKEETNGGKRVLREMQEVERNER